MASTLPQPNACCDPCTGLSVTIVETGSATVGWFVVNTIPDLRALPNLFTNLFAEVLGGEVIDDGFGSGYSWREEALNADDGIDWIKPNDTVIGAPGRWKRKGA